MAASKVWTSNHLADFWIRVLSRGSWNYTSPTFVDVRHDGNKPERRSHRRHVPPQDQYDQFSVVQATLQKAWEWKRNFQTKERELRRTTNEKQHNDYDE